MVFNGLRNLLSPLGLGSNGGKVASGGVATRRGYPSILITPDIIGAVAAASAVTVTGAAGFIRMGQFTVEAQTVRTWGFGFPNTAETGRLFVDTESTANADVDGLIRLAAANATQTAIDVVMQIRSELSSENPTDITKQVFFPEVLNYPVLGRQPREDDLLQMYFDFDTNTDTLTSSETLMRVHTTVYQ